MRSDEIWFKSIEEIEANMPEGFQHIGGEILDKGLGKYRIFYKSTGDNIGGVCRVRGDNTMEGEPFKQPFGGGLCKFTSPNASIPDDGTDAWMDRVVLEGIREAYVMQMQQHEQRDQESIPGRAVAAQEFANVLKMMEVQ